MNLLRKLQFYFDVQSIGSCPGKQEMDQAAKFAHDSTNPLGRQVTNSRALCRQRVRNVCFAARGRRHNRGENERQMRPSGGSDWIHNQPKPATQPLARGQLSSSLATHELIHLLLLTGHMTGKTCTFCFVFFFLLFSFSFLFFTFFTQPSI